MWERTKPWGLCGQRSWHEDIGHYIMVSEPWPTQKVCAPHVRTRVPIKWVDCEWPKGEEILDFHIAWGRKRDRPYTWAHYLKYLETFSHEVVSREKEQNHATCVSKAENIMTWGYELFKNGIRALPHLESVGPICILTCAYMGVDCEGTKGEGILESYIAKGRKRMKRGGGYMLAHYIKCHKLFSHEIVSREEEQNCIACADNIMTWGYRSLHNEKQSWSLTSPGEGKREGLIYGLTIKNLWDPFLQDCVTWGRTKLSNLHGQSGQYHYMRIWVIIEWEAILESYISLERKGRGLYIWVHYLKCHEAFSH